MKNSRKAKILRLLAAYLVIASTAQYASADSFNGNRLDKGVITTHYDASVTSYGYTNFFDYARGNWNNISSKVSVGQSTTLVSGYDRYFVGTTATAGLLGRTTFYMKNTSGAIVQAGIDDLWNHCTVAVYDNQMDAYAFTNAQRISNCTHEIGHTLKMAHPGQGTYRTAPIPSGRVAVMQQGIQEIGPQQYDKDELRFKWGL